MAKGMADRHPLLCVCSVFIGLVLRDGVQVCFDVSVQNKIGISQRVVVDESSSDRWKRLSAASFSTAVQSMEIMLPS